MSMLKLKSFTKIRRRRSPIYNFPLINKVGLSTELNNNPKQILGKKVYTIRAQGLNGSVVQTAGAETNIAFSFALSDIANYSAYTSIFDQYRIDRIRMYFRTRQNSLPTAAPSTFAPGLLYTVIDYDDANSLSIGNLERYQSSLIAESNESVVREFQPHLAYEIYNTPSAGFANMPSTWIDAGSSGQPHYGVKIGITSGFLAQTLLSAWDVTCEYTISFRSTF